MPCGFIVPFSLSILKGWSNADSNFYEASWFHIILCTVLLSEMFCVFNTILEALNHKQMYMGRGNFAFDGFFTVVWFGSVEWLANTVTS